MLELEKRARKRLLKMHFDAGVGHIGGNLSSLDAMLVLHHQVMNPEDVFILSKGHSAGALYVTQWTKGWLTDADLASFHKDGTKIAGHPICSEHIPFATGSLGHGLSDAIGMALGYKLQGIKNHVYCLTSDGEWQEGSNWEALIFAVNNKLTNLTILVDENGLQGFGKTSEMSSGASLFQRLQQFGVWAEQVDGHNHEALQHALQVASEYQVRVIVCKTTKGHGVSFMENRMEWHYLPLNAEQYKAALEEQ